MRVKRLSIILVLMAVAIPSLICSEPYFDYLGYEQGLSSSSVSSIVQDRFGFMWFGTQNGLNRYDGYSLKIYQNEPYNKNSLSHNLIQTMYLDGDTLWIGTYGGLVRLDLLTETFTRFSADNEDPKSLSSNVVVAICRDAEGSLWVGTLDGLNRMDEQEGSFTVYRPNEQDPTSLPNSVIRSLFSDSSGTLWIGSYGGLSRYERSTERFVTYSQDSESSDSLPSNFVMDIIELEDGKLALALWGSGITIFDPSSGSVDVRQLSENRMYKLLLDGQTLWAASFGGGLISYDLTSREESIFTSSDQVARPLSNDTVYSLLKDRSGMIWVGTNGGGINRILPGWDRYRLYKHSSSDPDSIAPGKVNGLTVDSTGAVWLSLYNSGISRLDRESGTFTHFRHSSSDPSSLSHDIVNNIYEAPDGKIYISTNDGLNLYDSAHDSFERFFLSTDSYNPLEDSILTGMVIDRKGQIWYGTYNQGVTRFDPSTGLYIHYKAAAKGERQFSDNLVRNMLLDSQGVLWVGTNHGLNRYDEHSDSFHSYFYDEQDMSSISSDNIYTLFEDSMDRLWIGTSGGGLNLYDRESDTFEYFSRQDGLSDNTVLAIQEDELGKLWVSTRFGLTVISKDLSVFRGLGRSGGFPVMELSLGSARLEDGHLLFGTTSGLIEINPQLGQQVSSSSRIVLTSLNVMGEPYGQKIPYLLKELVLEPDETFFEFTFTDMQYSSDLSSLYAYTLEGFDEDWNYISNRNYGSYTNLDPGSYTLKIRQVLAEDALYEGELQLLVRVKPPFYATGAAYGLYLLLLLVLCLLIYRTVNRKVRQKSLEIERQQEYSNLLERQIAERTMQIEHEKEQLAVTLSNIADAVVSIDTDRRILLLNTVAQKMFAVQEQAVLGSGMKSLFADSGEAGRTMDALIDSVNGSQGEGKIGTTSAEFVIAGHRRLLHVSAAAIAGEQQEIRGYVLVFRDVTREVEIQNKLQQHDKLQSLGVLAGGLAHDFNNLLVGLFGYIEMARYQTEPEEIKENLDKALSSYERAKALTHQLLTFAKGGEPVRRVCDIQSLVSSAVSFALSGSNVSSSITSEQGLWSCQVDEHQISQVIDNLVLNAKQAMPSGGTIEVELSNVVLESKQRPRLEAGEYVSIRISDKGEGIDEQIISNIFDPFFTTKQTGNGLGLTTCYSIITRHQGTIEVSSIRGQGSTFTVFLPRGGRSS